MCMISSFEILVHYVTSKIWDYYSNNSNKAKEVCLFFLITKILIQTSISLIVTRLPRILSLKKENSEIKNLECLF